MHAPGTSGSKLKSGVGRLALAGMKIPHAKRGNSGKGRLAATLSM
jgi:hypothetical protein